MQYIVLLNLLVSAICLHAGSRNAGKGGLKFPTERVHRSLRNRSLQLDVQKREIELAKNRERALIARVNAWNKPEKQIEDLYAQVDKEAAKILAAIDQLTLKALDLEALD